MAEYTYKTKDGVTITSAPEGIDEIVTSKPVQVHIERMNEGDVWMSIGDTHFWFHAAKGVLYNNADVAGGFGIYAGKRRGEWERKYPVSNAASERS